MRFMFVVKASKDSEAGIMPSAELISAMADYHEDLAKAGVLLDGSGLQPSSKGWRITWSGGRKTVTDGPFAETKELIAGYTIIQVKTREEAMEWANRFPNPQMENGQIEVRQMFDLEDFEPSEGIDRFRDMGIAQDRR
ncbi:YciI family protein [Aminobacter sp. BE322]|uniref:YciI family protein n=1 Tax=unclassified Aminobacter TaxID=2644704 RepID=UPI003D20EB37